MDAVIYIRWSSAEQGKGSSLERQRDDCRRHAVQKGWTVVDEIIDDGVSAFRGRHASVGGLGRFVAAVEAGAHPDGVVLVTEKLDRLSREHVSTMFEWMLRVTKLGIVVATVDGDPERAVWQMQLPDDIYCDAMCAWLARRRKQWDAWGQLAEREGADVLHLWLAELAKAEPLVPPERMVITKVADGHSVALRDDLPEPHISLLTVYRFMTGADRNRFYAWLAKGDPVRRPFDLARIWWLTGDEGFADALDHLVARLRAGGTASS